MYIYIYIGSFLPPEMDVHLTIEDFERSYDENEEFGLNDMNTRDFETGMYVCMYVCMCMYVCIDVYVRIHVYV